MIAMAPMTEVDSSTTLEHAQAISSAPLLRARPGPHDQRHRDRREATVGPKFFVLTPSYQRRDRILRCIESVEQQSYPNLEMFIVDDGSTDGTWNALQRYADDPRIHRSRFSENQGVNAARNHLLEKILERGEEGFVAILDDDDRYLPDALARTSEAMADYPDEKWFAAHSIRCTGERMSHLLAPGPICYLKDFKLGKRMSGTLTLFFHTSIVGKKRYPTMFKNSEEWYFYSGLARRSRMCGIDVDVTSIERLPDGLTHLQPNRSDKCLVAELKVERYAPVVTRRMLWQLKAQHARHLLLSGERERGWRLLGKCLVNWPFEPRIYQYFGEALLASLGLSKGNDS